jgi:hypothetical protein
MGAQFFEVSPQESHVCRSLPHWARPQWLNPF